LNERSSISAISRAIGSRRAASCVLHSAASCIRAATS